MSSKINGMNTGTTGLNTALPVPRTRDATSGAAESAIASVPKGDVHITDSASRRANLEQAVRDLPAVDEQRVAKARAAIQSGTYQVHPHKVASNLMSMEHSLGQLPDTHSAED